MKNLTYLIILLFVISNNSYGQSISKYFKSLEKGKSTSINNEWFADKEQKSTYKKLKKYLDSENRELRYNAYKLSTKVGLETTNSSLKNNVVLRLINGLEDTDKGVRKVIYTGIKKFNKEDFNYHSQEKIQILLESEGKIDKDLILIGGWIANDKILQVFFNKNSLLEANDGNKFYYNLALSRNGDVDAIENISRGFRHKKLDDRVLYAIGNDLLYTKQLDIYDIFITAIFSDEKNCSSGNPDITEKINCAYQIMVLLAPYIMDYPIKLDKWGDPIIDDDGYEEALSLTRKWLSGKDGDLEFVKGY